jgi:hypothetical protein
MRRFLYVSSIHHQERYEILHNGTIIATEARLRDAEDFAQVIADYTQDSVEIIDVFARNGQPAKWSRSPMGSRERDGEGSRRAANLPECVVLES